MSVEAYITDIFKEFGITEQTEFPPDEFFELYNKYGKLNQLKDANVRFAGFQPQYEYLKSTEAKLVLEIKIAESPKKEQLELELASIVDQKTSLESQIKTVQNEIDSLKTEMELK